MIWGLIMEPNKKYTQEVEEAFRLTNACLDTSISNLNCPMQVMLKFVNRDTKYLICTLGKNVWQAPLNLNIEKGCVVTFFCNGRGTVHLTGYYKAKINSLMEIERGTGGHDKWAIEDYDPNEDKEEGANSKRKGNFHEEMTAKRVKPFTFDDDNDDGDSNSSSLPYSDDDNIDMNESEDDNDKMQESEEEKSQGQEKKEHQQKKKDKEWKSTSRKMTNKGKEKQQESNVDKKFIIDGMKVIKLKLGTGEVAEIGQRVTIYYVARIKMGSYKPKIDQCLQGVGFRFRLGARLVLRGVDIGVVGMKVGEKRRLIIPPRLAYGSKGSPPDVPPFSTIIYDIELIKIE